MAKTHLDGKKNNHPDGKKNNHPDGKLFLIPNS